MILSDKAVVVGNLERSAFQATLFESFMFYQLVIKALF
jgi:hypothetical protein